MDISFLIRGFIIGFSIALAIGPIAILCIHRSITKGFLSGFLSGIGAASADGIYSAIAAFGLTFISSFLINQKLLIQLIGIIFLFYLGIKIFVKKQIKENIKSQSKSLLGDYLSTLFLTLTNPMTILSFIAVFAGLGLVQSTENSAFLLVLGFFLGSAIFYFILSIIFSMFSKKINPHTLTIINKIAGIIIIGFAIVILVSVVNNF